MRPREAQPHILGPAPALRRFDPPLPRQEALKAPKLRSFMSSLQISTEALGAFGFLGGVGGWGVFFPLGWRITGFSFYGKHKGVKQAMDIYMLIMESHFLLSGFGQIVKLADVIVPVAFVAFEAPSRVPCPHRKNGKDPFG